MGALTGWQRWARSRSARAGVVHEDVDRREIWERDRGLCWICRRPVPFAEMQLDHIFPLSKGGPTTAGNLACTHGSCNREKATTVSALPASELGRSVAWTYAVAHRLARIGVRAMPLYPAPGAFGPHVVTLRLWPAPGHVQALLRAAPEIEAVLGECRAGVPSIRFEAPYLCIEVPRMRPQPVALSAMRSQGLRVQVGVDTRGRAAVLDLKHDPMVLIAGITRYGKSTLLNNIALQLAACGARLALADGERLTFERFRGSSALAWSIADDAIDAVRLAQAVAAEIDKRPTDGSIPPLVFMCDEIQMVMSDPAGRKAVRAIAQRGGKRGIVGFFSTQYVKDSELDTVVKSQCGIRISFRQGTAQGARNVDLPGADRLTLKGDALISQGGRMVRAMIAMPADSDYARLTTADGSTPHAPVTTPQAATLTDDIAAWAAAQGGRVSAEAIRLESQRRAPDGRGIGRNIARSIRDAVAVGGAA